MLCARSFLTKTRRSYILSDTALDIHMCQSCVPQHTASYLKKQKSYNIKRPPRTNIFQHNFRLKICKYHMSLPKPHQIRFVSIFLAFPFFRRGTRLASPAEPDRDIQNPAPTRCWISFGEALPQKSASGDSPLRFP